MEIKFTIHEGSNHIHIPVKVNGEGPFEFTLDTGAIKTSLSKSLAEKLGLQTYELTERKVEGLPALAGKMKSFQIGSHTFHNEEVLIIDFESVLGTCTGKMGGVIGHTTLKNYKISINYQTQTLRLDLSEKIDSSKDVPFQWSKFNYIKGTHMVGVPVLINNQGPFEFVIDTGAGGTVITPQLASQLGLDQYSFDGVCRGLGGDAEGHLATLNQVSVGGITVNQHPVAVIDMNKITPKGMLIPNGILGYPFLKQFELIIDYPQERFAFVDHSKTNIESQPSTNCSE